MKLQELYDEYRDATAEASQRTQQLALGGIAITWLVRGPADDHSVVNLPQLLLAALLGFALALLLDFTQYVARSVMWYRHAEAERARLQTLHSGDVQRMVAADDLVAPRAANLVARLTWNGKVVSVLGGYLALLLFLVPRL